MPGLNHVMTVVGEAESSARCVPSPHPHQRYLIVPAEHVEETHPDHVD